MTRIIGVPDGRRVAVDCWGDPRGFPVLLLHGTPGSKSGPVPRSPLLYQLGVRLISYDRPGYGESDRQEGRLVVDAAADVLRIADALGLDEFRIVGRSGGGPHALACAARIDRSRLLSVTVLVGLAPHDAPDLDWFDGMTESNVNDYEAASVANEAMIADLTKRADEIRRDPEALLETLEREMTDSDRRIISDAGIKRRLLEAYRDALRPGPFGWIDDVLAFRAPWGFELSEVKVPVHLWHGAGDVFSPASHSRWMAGQIPDATFEVEAGAAHFAAMEILPRVLARMKAESLSCPAVAAAAAPAPAGFWI